MTKAVSRRDSGIDSLRAIAILMVVLYHAVMGAPQGITTLYLEFEAAIRYMPLEIFTAVSGYLYAMRRTRRGEIGRSIQVKARRLLIPLISMTTLLLLMRLFMPGTNNVTTWDDFLWSYVFRFEHLWYLQSLFLIFVVIAWIDAYELIRTPRALAVLILGWYAVSLVLPLNQFFGYAGLVQLMPFFLAGYGLRRWPEILSARGATPIAWLCFVAGMALEQLSFRGVLPLPDSITIKYGVLNLIAGIAFCFLCFRYRREVPVIGRIGDFSFSIYIFHTIGMALANRVAGLTPWEEDLIGLTALKVLMGVFLPIVLELGIRRSNLLSTLFLGEAWKWPSFLDRKSEKLSTDS